MKITDEMIAEDEKRWHARDVMTELVYCSTYMEDHKYMTNLNIRFYAYIMRRAYEMLKSRIPQIPSIKENAYGVKFYKCPNCGRSFDNGKVAYCDRCGQAVKW